MLKKARVVTIIATCSVLAAAALAVSALAPEPAATPLQPMPEEPCWCDITGESHGHIDCECDMRWTNADSTRGDCGTGCTAADPTCSYTITVGFSGGPGCEGYRVLTAVGGCGGEAFQSKSCPTGGTVYAATFCTICEEE